MELLTIKHNDFTMSVECNKFDAIWTKAKSNIGEQSLLLKLLTGRELMDLAEDEVNSIKNSPLFKHWTAAKVQLNAPWMLWNAFMVINTWSIHLAYVLARLGRDAR